MWFSAPIRTGGQTHHYTGLTCATAPMNFAEPLIISGGAKKTRAKRVTTDDGNTWTENSKVSKNTRLSLSEKLVKTTVTGGQWVNIEKKRNTVRPHFTHIEHYYYYSR